MPGERDARNSSKGASLVKPAPSEAVANPDQQLMAVQPGIHPEIEVALAVGGVAILDLAMQGAKNLLVPSPHAPLPTAR